MKRRSLTRKRRQRLIVAGIAIVAAVSMVVAFVTKRAPRGQETAAPTGIAVDPGAAERPSEITGQEREALEDILRRKGSSP